MKAAPRLATAVLVAITAACQGTATTVFPPGLEPVEVDEAAPAPPAAMGSDLYPEQLALTSGDDTMGHWARGFAYVHAPVAEVYAAMQDADVVADRRSVTSYTVTRNVEPTYETSFVTHYTVNDVVTVMFDVTWREGVVSGTTATPTQVSCVYQKTYGSTFVSSMNGSVELAQVTPTVTSMTWSQRLNALSTSPTNITSWTTDQYASVLARVRGQPLPTY